MNEIDQKVLAVFNKIVNGEISLNKIDYESHRLYFKYRDIDIELYAVNYSKKDEIPSNEYTTIEKVFECKYNYFSLTEFTFSFNHPERNSVYKLKINGKSYYIPKFSRVHEAEVMDKIEKIIQQYEESKLLEILR